MVEGFGMFNVNCLPRSEKNSYGYELVDIKNFNIQYTVEELYKNIEKYTSSKTSIVKMFFRINCTRCH